MKFAIFVVPLLLFMAPTVFGHGGEDHGAPIPTVSQSVAPRTTASSEEFEAVVVLENNKLTLYLDRFATNEPVVGAKVELDGAGLQGVAAESSPGVYAINAGSITPAKHPLTISIETANSADLLSATLDITPLPDGVEHPHDWTQWLVWSIAGALALAGGLMWTVRRSKQSKGVK